MPRKIFFDKKLFLVAGLFVLLPLFVHASENRNLVSSLSDFSHGFYCGISAIFGEDCGSDNYNNPSYIIINRNNSAEGSNEVIREIKTEVIYKEPTSTVVFNGLSDEELDLRLNDFKRTLENVSNSQVVYRNTSSGFSSDDYVTKANLNQQVDVLIDFVNESFLPINGSLGSANSLNIDGILSFGGTDKYNLRYYDSTLQINANNEDALLSFTNATSGTASTDGFTMGYKGNQGSGTGDSNVIFDLKESDGQFQFHINDSTVPKIIISNDGKLRALDEIPIAAEAGDGRRRIELNTTGTNPSYSNISAINEVNTNNPSVLRFYTTTGGVPNLAERMRIHSNGNVGIGTTTPSFKFVVSGTVGFSGLAASTGSGSLCLSGSQVVYNAASDACLPSLRETKHDITALDFQALQIVNDLEPVSFIYNEGDGRVRYGFIAEDASEIDGPLATYDAEGNLSGIDDRALLATSIKAIQELDLKISSLTVGDLDIDEISISHKKDFFSYVMDKVDGMISDGVLKLRNLVVNFLEADVVRVRDGVELEDQSTGEIYCLIIDEGKIDYDKGRCKPSGGYPDDSEDDSMNESVDDDSQIDGLLTEDEEMSEGDTENKENSENELIDESTDSDKKDESNNQSSESAETKDESAEEAEEVENQPQQTGDSGDGNDSSEIELETEPELEDNTN